MTISKQIVSTLGTDGTVFATRANQFQDERAAIIKKRDEEIHNLPSNRTTLASAIDVAIGLREFPKARLRGLEDAFKDLEVPNPKFVAIAIRGMLGHSRTGSAAAKFTRAHGAMVRDSAEATAVCLRDAGIETYAQLISAYKGDTDTDRAKAIRHGARHLRTVKPAGRKAEAMAMVERMLAEAEKADAADAKQAERDRDEKARKAEQKRQKLVKAEAKRQKAREAKALANLRKVRKAAKVASK